MVSAVKLRWIVAAAAALAAAASGADAQDGGIPVADLLRVADFSGLSASPDGRSVVFRIERADLLSNSYPTAWHAWTAEGGVRTLGGGGDVIHVDPGIPSHEAPVWSGDSAAIFFRALVRDEVQLWRAPLDGSGAAPVVADDSDIVSLSPADDGQGLTFVTGPSRDSIRRAEEEEYDSGILIEEHVDLAQNLFRGGIINGRRATQRLTGEWFSREGLLWRRPKAERYLDFASLEVREHRPPGEAQAQLAGPGRGPAHAVSRSGDEASAAPGANERGIEIRRSGGATLSCAAAECLGRVSWLVWGRSADELVFATQDVARAQSIHVWDLAGGGVRTLARSDGLLSGGREPGDPCVVAVEALFCAPSSAGSPPRLERIALDDGARMIVFDPNAELRTRLDLRVEHLRWRGAEGHEFTGTLVSTPEPSNRPRPLFVNYYLCEGFLRGGLGDEWPLAALAAAGIDALCITSTLLPGPQDALANNRAAEEGIRSIVERLGREGRTDVRRVGMGGLSFGSEVTLWLAFNTRLLAAASIASPGLEPAYYWFNGVQGRDNHEKLESAWGLRAPEETPERWRRLSAALNADRIGAPLLMQLPEQEARFVAELHARLSHSPTPVELFAFPDEPHIKVQPRHKLAAYQRNLDWFRYWLLGESDPDPMKRAQYERWDRLRARRAVLSATPSSASTVRGSQDRRSGSSEDRSAPAPPADRIRRRRGR
jgi:dipeptidyl aminopeptidase/acylaminoacyl peptidase